MKGKKPLFFHLNIDQIFMDQFGVVKPKFSDGFTSDLQSSLSASIGPSGLGHMCFKRGCKSYVDGIFKGDLGCQSTDNSVVRNLPPIETTKDQSFIVAMLVRHFGACGCGRGWECALVSECFHLRKKKVILVYHIWGIIKVNESGEMG